MPNNAGLLLIAGLGALFFLGRGGTAKKPDEDNRLVRGSLPGAPMAPAFELQRYIDGLFRDTATAPVQPPAQYFFPPNRVVTSSGVGGINVSAPDIITPTTKVAIGGDGGETITASALAVRRSEQIAQQQFEYAANVQPRKLAETLEANRIEEARQKKDAADLIAQYRTAQANVVTARTRAAQEQAKVVVPSVPPTIITPRKIGDFTYQIDEEYESLDLSPGFGGTITVGAAPLAIGDFSYIDDDDIPSYTGATTFAGEEEDDTFEISGGMSSPIGDFSYIGDDEYAMASVESPSFASEDEQPTNYGYYGGGEDE